MRRPLALAFAFSLVVAAGPGVAPRLGAQAPDAAGVREFRVGDAWGRDTVQFLTSAPVEAEPEGVEPEGIEGAENGEPAAETAADAEHHAAEEGHHEAHHEAAGHSGPSLARAPDRQDRRGKASMAVKIDRHASMNALFARERQSFLARQSIFFERMRAKKAQSRRCGRAPAHCFVRINRDAAGASISKGVTRLRTLTPAISKISVA